MLRPWSKGKRRQLLERSRAFLKLYSGSPSAGLNNVATDADASERLCRPARHGASSLRTSARGHVLAELSNAESDQHRDMLTARSAGLSNARAGAPGKAWKAHRQSLRSE